MTSYRRPILGGAPGSSKRGPTDVWQSSPGRPRGKMGRHRGRGLGARFASARFWTTRFSTTFSMLLAAACTGPEAGPSGVPEIQFEEMARFGSLEDEGSALSSVRDLALTDSTVLILESNPPRVAVFDHEGRWLRDLGREGEGPGEFRSPSEIGLIDGDVWVGSARRARLEILSQTGTSLASHRWNIAQDSITGTEGAYPGALLADGTVLAAPRGTMNPNPGRQAYYRATSDGEVLDRLVEVVPPDGETFTIQWGNGFVMGTHPLNRTPVVARLPGGDGLLVATGLEADRPDSAAFRIERATLTGRAVVEVPYQRVSAEGWLDAYIQIAEEGMLQRGEVDRAYLATLRETLGARRF